MAIYIEIKKIKLVDDTHYYSVKTKTLNGSVAFFVGIDTQKKMCHVYKQDITHNSNFSINLEKPYIDENIHDTVFKNLLYENLIKNLTQHERSRIIAVIPNETLVKITG